MREIFDFVNNNGFWVAILAIVAVSAWFKYRRYELRLHSEMRAAQLEHERRLKELEVEKARLEVEKAKQGERV